MQLPVTREVILAELNSAKAILESWAARVEEGIPSVDLPTPPEHLDDFMRPFCGELLIVAAKCESLSNVLSGEL